MKKRLFVSIPVAQPAQSELAAAQDRGRFRFRWVDPAQFHLTVCFLGDTEEALLPYISEALSQTAAQAKPFDLAFERIGLFPPKFAPPNMIWAFYKESEAFEDLVKATKQQLMKADASFMRLAEEWRKDIPHVTLARFAGRDVPKDFKQPAANIHVQGIELMESILYPTGPAYTTLAVFPFSQ